MDGLPTEIITNICTLLCSHCYEVIEQNDGPPDFDQPTHQPDQDALLSLCLTSSRLRDIAQTTLYHRVYLETFRVDRLVSLLRTILSRPDLARSVEHLSVSEMNACTLNDADWELFTQAALSSHLALAEPWYLEARSPGDSYTCQLMIGLLILHLPCISALKLEITQDQSCECSFVAAPPPSALSKLRVLYLHHFSGFMSYFSVSDFSTILQLARNLNYLSVSGCGSIPTRLPLTNVTSLSLEDSWLSVASMDHILSSCGGLEQFSYSCTRSRHGVRANDVMDLLTKYGHEKTLHSLSLYYPGGCRPCRRIKSLAGFSRLQFISFEPRTVNLSADGDSSTFVTSLPTSVDTLIFNGKAEDITGELYEIRDMKFQGKLPNLRKLLFRSDLETMSLIMLTESLESMGVYCH